MGEEKSKSQLAWDDSFGELALMKDHIDNATYSHWKWMVIGLMVRSVVHALWAIYFKLDDANIEI